MKIKSCFFVFFSLFFLSSFAQNIIENKNKFYLIVSKKQHPPRQVNIFPGQFLILKEDIYNFTLKGNILNIFENSLVINGQELSYENIIYIKMPLKKMKYISNGIITISLFIPAILLINDAISGTNVTTEKYLPFLGGLSVGITGRLLSFRKYDMINCNYRTVKIN